MITILLALALAQTIAQPPSSVPGEISPAVTQANIRQTICVSGYTGTVRPPSSFTTPLKLAAMAEFGLTGDPKNFEWDHREPIEVGGHPRSTRNMYNQPHPQHKWKDRLENAVRKDVCRSAHDPKRITLAAGQAIFLGDWYEEYVRRYGKRTK